MAPVHINLTTPLVMNESGLWFSAYGFGWGYCAFELRPDVICKSLGAANESPKQLLLAFQLGRQRLLGVAGRKAVPSNGNRIQITAEDL
ncbi:hypothetical protein [Paraburkholderia sp. BCC1885]|uniref:hypothetical protein n=1 Tax=Paraburkholderia sp. BCC1885 TaxID=2562669 RepID=UPI001183C8ED|nr:hypothetical protein [Paraburkholderia sp. BCC1885]